MDELLPFEENNRAQGSSPGTKARVRLGGDSRELLPERGEQMLAGFLAVDK